MRILVPVFCMAALLASSCATPPRSAPDWQDSEVFMLPQEAGFQWETLELRDGRFRYWSASDVMAEHPPKYPIEGTYLIKDNQLILSNDKTYSLCSINGTKMLWKLRAVQYWEQYEIIDASGMLVQVKSVGSEEPSLTPFFTKQQWDRSAEQVKELREGSKDAKK